MLIAERVEECLPPETAERRIKFMAGHNNNLKNIYLYARYERFWHWLQTALIILLLITGFEIKGLYSLFGFQTSVKVHNFVGNTWLIAFMFFVFWVITTGEWRICSYDQKDVCGCSVLSIRNFSW